MIEEKAAQYYCALLAYLGLGETEMIQFNDPRIRDLNEPSFSASPNSAEYAMNLRQVARIVVNPSRAEDFNNVTLGAVKGMNGDMTPDLLDPASSLEEGNLLSRQSQYGKTRSDGVAVLLDAGSGAMQQLNEDRLRRTIIVNFNRNSKTFETSVIDHYNVELTGQHNIHLIRQDIGALINRTPLLQQRVNIDIPSRYHQVYWNQVKTKLGGR